MLHKCDNNVSAVAGQTFRIAAVNWLWETEYYVEEDGNIPAIAFLGSVPAAVRKELIATKYSVEMAGGPVQFGNFEERHKAMWGVCDGLHEARDRHAQTLYRLYLLWFASERRVVVLDGAVKSNATTLPNSVYDRLATIRDRILESSQERPFASPAQVTRALWAVNEKLQEERDAALKRKTKAGKNRK